MNCQQMRPVLKWAGGKYRLLERIKSALPAGKRLIEPFAGSGVVFLNTKYKKNIVSDANTDLINLYLHIQSGGIDFINYCKTFFVPENNNSELFYAFREQFNKTDNLHLKAALFLYLNRHCFNGLCRYNSKGIFNVPFGRYTKPFFPEQELMHFLGKSLDVEFNSDDFTETMENATIGDVVYCDPPYVPLSLTSSFTDYTSVGFGLNEQLKLAELACKLMTKGIPVIISNHDTSFTRGAYSLAQIESFKVQRFISSDGANRNKVSELLAIFI